MKKCPKCGTEVTDETMICPNCQAELEKAKSKKTNDSSTGEKTFFSEEENDDITWSDYSDVPLGKVMKDLESLQDEKPHEAEASREEISEIEKSQDENSVADKSAEKKTEDQVSILENYIHEHKESENGSEIEAVTSNKAEDGTPTFPEPNSEKNHLAKKRVPKTSHKRIRYVVIVAIAILLLGAGTFKYVNQKQKAEAARQEELQKDQALTKISESLDGFYVDKDHQFIKSEKTTTGLNEVITELNQYQEEPEYEKLYAKAQKIQVRLAVINEINHHFSAPILVGDALRPDVHLKEDMTMDMALLDTDDAFSKLANQAIQQGKDETASIASAQDTIAGITAQVKDGKLADVVSKKDLEAAEKQVAALFEGPQKTTLTASLEPAQQALVKREAEEQKAKLAAELKAQEAAKKEKQAAAEAAAAESQNSNSSVTYNEGQEILSKATPTNRNNQPIISSRQSDINDTNNAGWVWADGIYDQVINECIKRGYIVAGGFTLEPVRIENGEGYYNLYATNTNSTLMQGVSEKALPMYLVTINCKTGFFRGNASGT